MKKNKDSELLMGAIADAKAVKETAFANAQLAITEAFNPRLQSMLSARLKNEVEGEEDLDNQLPDEGGEQVPDDVNPDLEKEAAPQDPTDNANADPEKEKAGKVPGSPKADGPLGENDGDPDSEPDADPDDKITAVGEEIPAAGEEELGTGDDEQKEFEALVKELEDMDNESPDGAEEPVFSDDSENPEPSDDDVQKESLPSVTADANADPEKEKAGRVAGSPAAGYESDAETELAGQNGERYPDLDVEAIVKEVEQELGIGGEEGEEEDEDGKKEKEMESLKTENKQLKGSLKKHQDVVKYLRARINEVNLLNGKLLYATKLFRTYNLTEGQKLRIVEAIDRAVSTREVKLVYATLSESFKLKGTGKVNEVKKQRVTEGSASKPAASTKPAVLPVISEGAELAARFKRLAGMGVGNNTIKRIL